jgi:uncharacterized protein (TIGR03435 family)
MAVAARIAAVFSLLLAHGPDSAVGQGKASTQFELASVRPAGPDRDAASSMRGGPGTSDPERITYERVSLLRLLSIAYGSATNNVLTASNAPSGLSWEQIVGPAWIASEQYSIAAKLPPGTTIEQVRLMWQGLLAERFNLKVHFTTNDFPVYELLVAQGGPKLRKAGGPERQAPGFPVLRPGDKRGISVVPPRTVRLTFRDYSIKEFLEQLAFPLSSEGASGYEGYLAIAKVSDKTGLDGLYDFTFEFAGRWGSAGGAFLPPLPNGETGTASDLFSALQQQLGLRLEEKKTNLPVLVVDHVDRVPTEN